MKFKKIIIFLIICCLITIMFNLNVRQNNNQQISEELAVFIENNKTTNIPEKTSGYIFDEEKSNCTNNALITWNEETWTPIINNLAESRTKCNLYFKKKTYDVILFSETIILKNSYTLQNMVKNGGFENGLENWNIKYSNNAVLSSENPYEGKNGIKFLKNKDNNGIPNSAYIDQQVEQLIPETNHLYYGSMMFYSSNSFYAEDSRYEWWANDKEYGRIMFLRKTATNNKWIKISSIQSVQKDTYFDQKWVVRNFVRNTEEDSYGDNVMLLDLTKIFGKNNEPSSKFLDSYVPFFEKEANILINSQETLETKEYSYDTLNKINELTCTGATVTYNDSSIIISNPYDTVFCKIK